MRILIDARLYGPEHTGNGRYTMNLVEGLAKLDKKNDYIIFLREKYFKSLVFPNNFKKVLADFKHYTFEEQFKLPFLISKYKPDVVHFPHLNVPLLYFGKYIVTIHDLIMHKFKGGEATTRPFPIYQIWRLGYYVAFAKAVFGAKKIIVPSESVKKDIINYYKVNINKIDVIYEGFDEKIVKSTKKFSKYSYFVYVGNAYPHKNIETLIEAIKILNTKVGQDVKLLISSARNIFTQRLQLMTKRHQTEKLVELLGFVPDSQLGSLYNKSVGFITASLEEGFGLPGLEAISSGTLILTSDIPVFKEVYGDSSFYFNPKDPNSIAQAMEKVLKLNTSERKKLILKSQKFVKKYSWPKMAKECLSVYNSI